MKEEGKGGRRTEMEKNYRIGDRTYVQRPIVLGQLRMLLPLLEGVRITGGTPLELAGMLGSEKLGTALAVVLVEEGLSVVDAMKSIEARAEEIGYAVTPEQALEAVEDFFACNRVSSLLERLLTMLIGLRTRITRAYANLSESSTASPEAISPEGTPSSGV